MNIILHSSVFRRKFGWTPEFDPSRDTSSRKLVYNPNFFKIIEIKLKRYHFSVGEMQSRAKTVQSVVERLLPQPVVSSMWRNTVVIMKVGKRSSVLYLAEGNEFRFRMMSMLVVMKTWLLVQLWVRRARYFEMRLVDDFVDANRWLMDEESPVRVVFDKMGLFRIRGDWCWMLGLSKTLPHLSRWG